MVSTSPQLKGGISMNEKLKTTTRDDKMILQNAFKDLRNN